MVKRSKGEVNVMELKQLHEGIQKLNKQKKSIIDPSASRPTPQEAEQGTFECDACCRDLPLKDSLQWCKGDSMILCVSCWNTIHRLCNHTMCSIMDMVDGLKEKRNKDIQTNIDSLNKIIKREFENS